MFVRTQLQIKRIGLWSLFKIAFLLYAGLGLIMGLLYGVFIMLAGWIENAYIGDEFAGLPDLGVFGGLLGLVAIPFIALMYGAMGSVFVTLGGVLYNLVARVGGGLSLDTTVEVGAPESGADPPPTL